MDSKRAISAAAGQAAALAARACAILLLYRRKMRFSCQLPALEMSKQD